jgi:hypothetical protein
MISTGASLLRALEKVKQIFSPYIFHADAAYAID